ncbi:putative transcriptional regulator [Bacillus phage vB_BceM_Bc431v3]|uniref:Putative transcriptional regulator n=1 Tax=Bacillus phage vB_BceM_Bc431v3 TaxID=1195072 RepID=M4HN91_9CAUD|nr:HTH DNA binding protein [Bacillus phage vB_BceM_Bc431v3]AFQ96508.1 putative transcriptional regulator [Bacillus phage vB_BceM_Bc431v3]
MECGVYLESSVVGIKPRVLDFLTKLVDKAKQVSDYAISFTKKELSSDMGQDIRTTHRYLQELESKKIIELKAKRGRGGGTVIMFNPALIRFETSDKALINSEERVTIEDVLEEKLPKKQKEPKEKKRNRRTKQQLFEAQLLRSEKQKNLDEVNDKLEDMGNHPNWELFQGTDNPVGNYRTYLITRLYNRYAVLFTDKHNFNIANGLEEGNAVPTVSSGYDVLPERFFGSSRWQQFEKFREFCEEGDIDPAVYLSAQFNRSIFDSSRKGNKKMLPFTNALMGDTSYDVYKQYCSYQKSYSGSFKVYHEYRAKFMNDFVVVAIRDAYEHAEKGTGLLQYGTSIKEFLRGDFADDRADALVDFYDMTSENLVNKKVSFKTRNTIKKFLVLQSLMQLEGEQVLPRYVILGSEMAQIALASVNDPSKSREQVREIREFILGALVQPNATKEQQKLLGGQLYYEMVALHETRNVLQLIAERKSLALTLADLREAFAEYGKEKIPVDDFSMLDITQVVDFIDKAPVQDVVDHKDITSNKDWELTGSVKPKEQIDNLIDSYFGS